MVQKFFLKIFLFTLTSCLFFQDSQKSSQDGGKKQLNPVEVQMPGLASQRKESQKRAVQDYLEQEERSFRDFFAKLVEDFQKIQEEANGLIRQSRESDQALLNLLMESDRLVSQLDQILLPLEFWFQKLNGEPDLPSYFDAEARKDFEVIWQNLRDTFHENQQNLYQAYLTFLDRVYPERVPFDLWCHESKQLPAPFQRTLQALIQSLPTDRPSCAKVPFLIQFLDHSLDLGGLSLQTLVPLISLPQLKRLNVAGSHEASLGPLSRLRALEVLDVSKNQKSVLPFFLKFLSSLRFLQADGAGNQQSWWSQALYLSDFHLRYLSLEKVGLKDLKFLQVQDGDQKIYENLEFLILAHNPLTFSPDFFKGLPHLKLLDLSGTGLISFDNWSLPHLRVLNLSHNPLRKLILNEVPQLRTLNLLETEVTVQTGHPGVEDLRVDGDFLSLKETFPQWKMWGRSQGCEGIDSIACSWSP